MTLPFRLRHLCSAAVLALALPGSAAQFPTAAVNKAVQWLVPGQ
jgi:hypothetical protein